MPVPRGSGPTSEPPVVTIVHTSILAVESLTALFEELGPEVELRHVVDEGLLPEIVAKGEVTPALRLRLLASFRSAADDGCDVIFSQCSSVGDVAEEATKWVDVPVIRIDTPMAEEACRAGPRVGVLATLTTTLDPTRRLLLDTAARVGARIVVVARLVEGAFDLLEAGDRAAHDDRVLDAARGLLGEVHCLVLAQGTMAAILPRLGQTRVPVLTSPRLGVKRAVEVAREAVRRKGAG